MHEPMVHVVAKATKLSNTVREKATELPKPYGIVSFGKG